MNQVTKHSWTGKNFYVAASIHEGLDNLISATDFTTSDGVYFGLFRFGLPFPNLADELGKLLISHLDLEQGVFRKKDFLFSYYQLIENYLDLEGLINNIRISTYSNFKNPDDFYDYVEPCKDFVQAMFGLALISIIYQDEYFSCIDQYAQRLVSIKTSLTSKNKWGDVDNSKWIAQWREFAYEKLPFFGSLEKPLFDENYPLVTEHYRKKFFDHGISFIYMLNRIHTPAKDNKSLRVPEPTEDMDGYDYENLVSDTLREAFPEAVVQGTPKSADQGADIIFNLENRRIAIQVKMHKNPVGNYAVQEAISARHYYGANYGLVINTNGYTKSAIDLAQSTGIYLAAPATLINVIHSILKIT